MKNFFIIFIAFLLILPKITFANKIILTQKRLTNKSSVDFPEVPRISAKNAFLLFKSGKAIIVHSGGQKFERRHINGAINISQEAVSHGKIKLPRLPKKNIYIITYCYWTRNSAGAGLASYYMKRGYRNVKTVEGGGAAMEKYFDHYKATYDGGEIISPLTGKVFKIKK